MHQCTPGSGKREVDQDERSQAGVRRRAQGSAQALGVIYRHSEGRGANYTDNGSETTDSDYCDTVLHGDNRGPRQGLSESADSSTEQMVSSGKGAHGPTAFAGGTSAAFPEHRARRDWCRGILSTMEVARQPRAPTGEIGSCEDQQEAKNIVNIQRCTEGGVHRAQDASKNS
jgi:hypothetical protein